MVVDQVLVWLIVALTCTFLLFTVVAGSIALWEFYKYVSRK